MPDPICKDPQLGLIYCPRHQGFIVAPTLFLVFINDLLTLPPNTKVRDYANDTTFNLSTSSLSLLQDLVSSEITLRSGANQT